MTGDNDRTPVARKAMTMCTRCETELNHVVVAHDAMGSNDNKKIKNHKMH